MNEFTIFTQERLKIDGKTIEEPKEIGRLIRLKINELLEEGQEVSIYWKPNIKQTPGWKKIFKIIDPY